MSKLIQIIHTIRHLRPIQIRYQLWYRLRKMWRKATGFKYPLLIEKQGTPVKLRSWIEKPVSFSNEAFTFLNLTKKYNHGKINWNETQHGKLWAYNLNYMDYLLQPGMDNETGLRLIENYIQNLPKNHTASEPYPIALRGINWIKFLSKHRHCEERPEGATRQSVNSQQINSSLYAQYLILLDNIEYHLLANHLLEDGFSLLFGAIYFNDEKFYKKAKQILTTELNEQILDDGAHFELSPMYHQIILDRLLDCINLLQNNQRFENQHQLLEMLQNKAQEMLSWLNIITFSSGEIPLLNDAAPGIAPTTKQLNEYAANLNLLGRHSFSEGGNLSSSGYRKFTSPDYECIIDIGQIGPSYQPGHAHADTFNFVLNVNNEPLFIDTGISTYNFGKTRLKERGTAAHNTVTIQDKNSSEVWSSFRVARRAKVKALRESGNSISTQHDGYKRFDVLHQREWIFSDTQIDITDNLTGSATEGKAHFWLFPALSPKQNGQTIFVGNTIVSFENADAVNLILTQIPNGYNRFMGTYKMEVLFRKKLKLTITFID